MAQACPDRWLKPHRTGGSATPESLWFPFDRTDGFLSSGQAVSPHKNIHIMAAKKEILIVSPRLHPGKVKRFLDALLEAHGRGVSVCIHTKNPDELKLDMQEGARAAAALLEEYNFSVEYKPGLYQKLAVIDNEIVWYGSMDLLAYSRSEENFMRVKDSYVAGELISFC